MPILYLSFLFLLNSCAFLYQGNKERDLQTEIHRKISEKIPRFSECAQNSGIFEHFETNRVMSTLYIEINQKGELEKFKLDNKDYPEAYIDCFFNVIELINFPKNQINSLVKVEQPFVFTKN